MGELFERDLVLRRIAQFLDLVPHARPLLTLQGEPGAGKTAVWLEAVSAAQGRGFRVFQAQPAESEANFSYSGVTDLLGRVFDEVAHSLPLPQAQALAAALLRGDSERPVELRAVATSVLTVVAQMAATGPVLLAVDDVHWLDAESARVLAFVARRLPDGVRLLLAVRSGSSSAASPLLRSLPSDEVQRLELEPLSVDALHSLLQDRIGLSLTRPALTRLAEAVGGNPLFALEVGRALIARPHHQPSDPLPVPSSLNELVVARVEQLSAPAQELLLAAACLSRPTTTDLARVFASSHNAIVEARNAELIVLHESALRFTHPLFASAVYGLASPDSRAAMHRRLADTIEEPEQRARHLAAGTMEPDQAISAELERAADRASFRGAKDAAADLFEASWRLTAVDQQDDRARRMLGQAAALNSTGDFAAAASIAERALDAADAAAVRASALLLLANMAWFEGAARKAVRLLEDALMMTPDEMAQRGVIHAHLVRFGFSLDLRAALDHAGMAVRQLSEQRHPDLLAQVLIDRISVGV